MAEPVPELVARLTEALQPFARVADALDHYIPEAMPFGDDDAIFFPRGDVRISDGPGHVGISWRDFYRARKALALLNTRSTDNGN